MGRSEYDPAAQHGRRWNSGPNGRAMLFSIDEPSLRLPAHRLLRLRFGFAPTGIGMGRPNDDPIALAKHPPGLALVQKVARNPDREGMFCLICDIEE